MRLPLDLSSPLLLTTSLRYDPLLLSTSWNTWLGNSPSPFFMLPYHLERLIDGAREFDWPVALEALGVAAKDATQNTNCKYKYATSLEKFRSICQGCVNRYFAEHPGSDVDHPLKIRITLSSTGSLHADASLTPRRPYDLLAASTFDPSQLNAATINKASFDLSTLTLPFFASPPLHVLLDTQPTPPSMLTSHKTTFRPHYDAARARASIPPPSSPISSSSPPTEILLHTPGLTLISEGSIRNVAFYRGNRWTTPPLSTGCLPGTTRRWLVESGRVAEGDVLRSDVKVGEWAMLCNGVEGCVLGVVVGTAEGPRKGEGQRNRGIVSKGVV